VEADIEEAQNALKLKPTLTPIIMLHNKKQSFYNRGYALANLKVKC
jgi:hypothetical protein